MSEPPPPMGTCPECGSNNLAAWLDHWDQPIPAGTHGFIGCRYCKRWWDVEATTETDNIFSGAWEVTAMGKGTYHNRVEKAATVIWRRP